VGGILIRSEQPVTENDKMMNASWILEAQLCKAGQITRKCSLKEKTKVQIKLRRIKLQITVNQLHFLGIFES